MGELRDVTARHVQNEQVALARIAVGAKHDALPVRGDSRRRVVVRPKRELLGVAALDRQAEQVPEHGEDQPLPVG